MLTRSRILRILRDLNAGKLMLHDLRGEDFEPIIALLLESLNCQVEKWGRIHQLDVDFLVTVPLHAGAVDCIVECKQRFPDQNIDIETIRAFYRTIGKHNVYMGMFITTSHFTKRAVDFCERQEPPIALYDAEYLESWIRSTLDKEEKRANGLALQIGQLVLTEIQRIQEGDIPQIITPEYLRTLVLPDDYQKRILITDSVPFRLVQEVVRDPRHMKAFTSRKFEEFIAELLDALRFKNIILTPEKNDGGRDIIATRIISEIPVTCYFECKKYAKGNKIQLHTLRALLGTVAHHATKANIGVLVTTSTFTKGCKDLIMSETRLNGKDYAGILGWLDEYKTIYPVIK